MGTTIDVETQDGWAMVRIAREAKRNALDRATRDGLRDAFESLSGKARAIVLTGTGGSFCAGLDLKEREADKAAGRPDTAGAEAIALNMAIRNHPAIFIAGVNGLALGGGVTLINLCDLAVASHDAKLGAPEIGFATYAGMAGPTTQLLLTRKRAAWFLLTAERLDAATALDWGLINEVAEPEALLPRCRELAARIAGFDAAALAETKKALNHIPTVVTDWQEAMEHGQQVNRAIRTRTSAAAEGLRHFAGGGRNPGQGS